MPGPVTRYGGSSVADVEYRQNFKATVFDGINLTDGNLTIGQGVSLDLVFNSAGSNVNWHNTFWDANQSWVFIDNVVKHNRRKWNYRIATKIWIAKST